MPCLTHLSFTAGGFLSLLPPLLNTSKSLHVLIYLGLVAISGGHPAFVDLQSDPRGLRMWVRAIGLVRTISLLNDARARWMYRFHLSLSYATMLDAPLTPKLIVAVAFFATVTESSVNRVPVVVPLSERVDIVARKWLMHRRRVEWDGIRWDRIE
ncbi:hypothetical protein B0H13DRAFT_1915191 [Mycena leptocephala]|nr:hypothetical protein B0H13DRAFT_1915191 [Mycena leptocephala]